MIEKIKKEAGLYNACGAIRNIEDLDGLVKLMFEPRGIEFCGENNFPSTELLHDIDSEYLKEHNIFVDDPDGYAVNAERVAVYGNSDVFLEYNDPDKRYIVFVNGGKAHIKAGNWTVVFVFNYRGDIIEEVSDNALIL